MKQWEYQQLLMSRKPLVIHEGALLLGDAHYSLLWRPQLLSFFEAIASKKIVTTQLILCGDIFDALFGYVPQTYQDNSELIALLNMLSLDIEVIYLEGNHDFALSKIFPHIQIFPLHMQPLEADFANKKVLLAHGDFDAPFGYKFYTTLIRNSWVLRVLNWCDTLCNHTLLHRLDDYLQRKEDCNHFEGFEAFVTKRMKPFYGVDYFIEGHFHQNISFDIDTLHYINLAAFACNQRYFTVKSSQDNGLLLVEKQFN